MSGKISLHDRLVGTREGKRQWRDYTRRRDLLPPDYKVVMTQIERFMYRVAMDGQVTAVFTGILELFEEGAAAGRPVLAVTGDDVADFALSVMQAIQAESWTGQQARHLNEQVHRQLAVLGGDDGRG